MNRTAIIASALLAASMPFAALAQGVPQASPAAAERPGLTDDMRAKVDAARTTARDAALAALSPAHRASVQSIVAAVTAGTTTDVRAAATQIDALLTADESAAVLAQNAKLRDTLRTLVPQRPDGPPPGAPRERGPNGMSDGAGAAAHPPSAGLTLLRLSLSREVMRLRRPAEGPDKTTAPK